MLKRMVAFKDVAQQNNLIKTVILNTQSIYVCWLRKKIFGLRILIWRPLLFFLPINEACIWVIGIQDICHFTSRDIGYYPFYFQGYRILYSISGKKIKKTKQ